MNDLEKMLFIIKNGWRLENQPQELHDEIFTRLFSACDIPRFDEAKRIQYEKDMFDERRYNGEIAAARQEGREEGKLTAARNLFKLGVDLQTIVQATGLTPNEITGE